MESLEEVVTNNLSPIEKYDLYVGNKNFELTHLEKRGPAYLQQEKFLSGKDSATLGHAAYLYDNPQAVTVSTPQGKKSLLLRGYKSPLNSASSL